MQEPLAMSEVPRVSAYSPAHVKQMLSCDWEIKKYRGNKVAPHWLEDVIHLPANSLVGGGHDMIWKALTTTALSLSPSTAYMGVGSSAVPTVSTMTDLQTAGVRATVSGAATARSGVTWGYTWTATFGDTVAEFQWNELGLFEQAAGGRMFNRRVFNLGTKVAGQSWVVSATLAFNQSGFTQCFCSDDFTDTAATDLKDHVGEYGANGYVRHVTGGGTALFDSTGNTVYTADVGSTTFFFPSGFPSSVDQLANITFKSLGTPTNSRLGVVFRSDLTAQTHYRLYWSSAAQQWKMDRVVAAAVTNLANFSDTLTTGTAYTMTALVKGNVLSIYRDGTLVLTYADTSGSALLTMGRCGLYLTNTSGGVANDSSNGLHALNWSGYNLWQ